MPMFEPLLSTRDGIGPYRINRYRIYIRRQQDAPPGPGHNRGPRGEAEDRAKWFKANFHARFNPNEARVEPRNERYNHEGTMRFVLNASPFGSENPVLRGITPNAHADWVGFEHTHNLGFTVQTLKRNFISGLDWAVMGGATAVGAAGGGMAGPLGAVAGGVLGAAGSYGAVRANAHHFLAGRRSWIFAPAAEVHANDARFVEQNGLENAVIFETAAVERLSAWWFREADRFGVMGKFDKSIHRIWVRLMTNYRGALRMGWEAVDVTPPRWKSEQQGVCFIEDRKFDNLKAVRGADIYGDMSRWHQKLLPEMAGLVV